MATLEAVLSSFPPGAIPLDWRCELVWVDEDRASSVAAYAGWLRARCCLACDALDDRLAADPLGDVAGLLAIRAGLDTLVAALDRMRGEARTGPLEFADSLRDALDEEWVGWMAEAEGLKRTLEAWTEPVEWRRRAWSLMAEQRWSEAVEVLELTPSLDPEALFLIAWCRRRFAAGEPRTEHAHYSSHVRAGQTESPLARLATLLYARLLTQAGRAEVAQSLLADLPRDDDLASVRAVAGLGEEPTRAGDVDHLAKRRPLTLLSLLTLDDEGWKRARGLLLNAQQAKIRQAQADQASVRRAQSRAAEASRVAGVELVIPAAIEEAAGLPRDNLFSAWLSADSASLAARQAMVLAGEQLVQRERRLAREADELRAELAALQEAREAQVQAAAGERSQSDVEARQSLSQEMWKAGKLQTGCMVLSGIGCAVGVLYALAVAVLAGMGWAIGPTTPLGGGILGLAATPLLIGLAMQVAYGLRYTRLEREMESLRKSAADAYAQRVRAADAAYRSRVPALRERLTGVEQEIVKLRDGLRALREG